jgi:hypothetical protein
MPTTATTTSSAWQEGGPAAAKALVVTKRCVSTAALSATNPTHMAELRDAAGAKPLQLLGSFSTTTLLGPMRVRSAQFAPVSADGKIWDAVITYGTEYVWCTIAAGGGTDQYINPIESQFVSTERVAAQYRRSFTTSPAANANGTTDIGGTATDQAGQPVQARIPAGEGRISILVDTSQKTLVQVYDAVATIRGCVNNAVFLHWSANKLFCTSADATLVRDEWYRATFNFKWDLWDDCEQVPDRDNDNFIKLNSTGKAASVYWRSFFRNNIDFNYIFAQLTSNQTLATQIAREGSFLTFP